jgi:hypothetical protein
MVMDNQKINTSGKASKGLVVLLTLFIAASILIAAIESSQVSPQFQTFYKYLSQLISGPIIMLLLPFGFKIDLPSVKIIGTICAVFIVVLTFLVASRKCRISNMGIYITIWFITGYVLYFLPQMYVG